MYQFQNRKGNYGVDRYYVSVLMFLSLLDIVIPYQQNNELRSEVPPVGFCTQMLKHNVDEVSRYVPHLMRYFNKSSVSKEQPMAGTISQQFSTVSGSVPNQLQICNEAETRLLTY